jgi:hypothetical protein
VVAHLNERIECSEAQHYALLESPTAAVGPVALRRGQKLIGGP